MNRLIQVLGFSAILLLTLTSVSQVFASGNSNTVMDNNWGSSRGYSDYYVQVNNLGMSYTVSSSTGTGSVCDGCWSIQFNTQGANFPWYQFIISVTNYNYINGVVEMILPTTGSCPAGWSVINGNYLYCGMATAQGYSGTSFASTSITFTIQPTVSANGAVQSASFSASNWGGASITIPSGYQTSYTYGQVNIVGWNSNYYLASFTFSPARGGSVWYYSQSSSYYMEWGGSMSYTTNENSNVQYGGVICPCGTSGNEWWG